MLTPALAQKKPVIQEATVKWLDNTSTVYEAPRSDGLKSYYLKTDAPLRDDVPTNKEIKIDESIAYPNTRTASPLFDSLFALAMQEVQKSSVTTISDPGFEDAKCDCFETGEKWRYVWTRDTAYATDLGLAAIDPLRSMNSLLFKISGFRNNLGVGEQIVQDTGSGGSWPVSTDRVVWSLGALETLKHLSYQSETYNFFLNRSYKAMKNTVLTDRKAVFDQEDGLYTGEQSFLDWREQSYPEWTATKVVHIGMSKSLSTNVAHYMALTHLADLAQEINDNEYRDSFKEWARELKASINKHFWDGTSYRSIKTTYLDQRAIKYYDLLGISLAIISGISSPEQSSSALNSYPHTQVGAPVIWPQRQDIAIYHNRSIWPFVTAYALKAAKKVQDPFLISSFIRSLIIGPAQNLSHMENYEFLTLRNYFADGRLSGPVVNSRRQLWSVAGYTGMVMDVIFGKEVKSNAIRFVPSLPLSVRNDLFSRAPRLELNNFKFQGHKIKVVLNLPVNDKIPLLNADGLLTISSVTFNGKAITGDFWIKNQDLQKNGLNEVVINLSGPGSFVSSKMIKLITPENPYQVSGEELQELYAPKTPVLNPVGLSDNSPLLSFLAADTGAITYHVYKNGLFLGKTAQTYFLDRGHPLDLTACYSVTAVYGSGNESFPSEPFCYWPISSVQHYPVNGPQIRSMGGSQVANANGRVFLHEWGLPGQKLQLEKVSPTRTGAFAIQVEYSNHEKINTGITCAAKKVTVINDQTGKTIKTGIMMLPHHEGTWTDSSFISVNLEKDQTYTILIEDFLNMSYLNHFKSYKYRGGRSGIYNMFNFAEIKVLFLGH